MTELRRQRSTRARPARAASCSTRTARSSTSTSASTSRSPRRPAGSSTTRRRSGSARAQVIGGAMADTDVEAGDVAAIGITNQRETTVVWDRETGEPIHNAIVWQDTRTDALVRELAGDEGVDRLREAIGLPLSTYFAGPKITLDPRQRRRRAREGRGRRAGVRDDGHLGAVEPHRRHERRRARHRRHQRQPDDADGPRDARLARAEPRADGHPALDAARDPLLHRALRRGGGHRARRAAGRRHPRRPARRRCSARRASTAATRRTPTAPARSCSSTPARRSCAPRSC